MTPEPKLNHPSRQGHCSHARVRRRALRPSSWLAAGLALLLTQALAHEWNSPPARQPDPAWSGLIWAGPASGPPPAPAARHCEGPPSSFELDAPELPGRQDRHRPRTHGARSALEEGGSAEPDALAGKAARKAVAAAPAERPADPALGRDEAQDAPVGKHEAEARQRLDGHDDARAQAAQPVTAGMVDDNADFQAFVAFQRRHGRLAPDAPDITERHRLIVHDAAGRPVPDAQVTVRGAAVAAALHARTDAGGEVWLHPRAAGLRDRVLDVQVQHRDADGRVTQGQALLQRGQRDALQVTLDAGVALRPARLDLVFLVDATGSMADEIDKLRHSMHAIADQIAALPSRPLTCFALVAYRDRGDAFFVRGHDFTHDLAAFQQALDGLHADGGGDYPEALDEALHTAVHRLSWRGEGATRLVLLVADAPPHLDRRAPATNDDMQGALARGIKLFTLGASGLDRRGELVFRRMAQYTGGRFVFLTYADARRPSSGPGRETTHDVSGYSVHTLDKLIVRLVRDELARRPA